jgi:hypothetical protein
VAGRFPIYTDADVLGPLIQALVQRGWDVLRAIDAYPEKTQDHVHFERAARDGRVLVSHDTDQLNLALRWIAEGRAFRGLLTWAQLHHLRFTESAFVTAFEKLAAEEDPFPAAYPIRYLHVD